LAEAEAVSKQRDQLGAARDLTTWHLARLLERIASAKATERLLSVPFEAWVAETFRDEYGQSRTAEWASKLREQARAVEPWPALVARLQAGWQDGRRCTLNSCYLAARLAREARWEEERLHAGMDPKQAREEVEALIVTAAQRTTSEIREAIRNLDADPPEFVRGMVQSSVIERARSVAQWYARMHGDQVDTREMSLPKLLDLVLLPAEQYRDLVESGRIEPETKP
jgi:hypothetical protein